MEINLEMILNEYTLQAPLVFRVHMSVLFTAWITKIVGSDFVSRKSGLGDLLRDWSTQPASAYRLIAASASKDVAMDSLDFSYSPTLTLLFNHTDYLGNPTRLTHPYQHVYCPPTTRITVAF